MSGDFLSHGAADLFPNSDTIETSVSPLAEIAKHFVPETIHSPYAIAEKLVLVEGKQPSALHGLGISIDWRTGKKEVAIHPSHPF